VITVVVVVVLLVVLSLLRSVVVIKHPRRSRMNSFPSVRHHSLPSMTIVLVPTTTAHLPVVKHPLITEALSPAMMVLLLLLLPPTMSVVLLLLAMLDVLPMAVTSVISL